MRWFQMNDPRLPLLLSKHFEKAKIGWQAVLEISKKDFGTSPIGFDSGYRSPDPEMFPQMVPRFWMPLSEARGFGRCMSKIRYHESFRSTFFL